MEITSKAIANAITTQFLKVFLLMILNLLAYFETWFIFLWKAPKRENNFSTLSFLESLPFPS